MAYQPKKCNRDIDDFPSVRANCEGLIKRGERCHDCPDHPDSPERAIAVLKGLVRDNVRALRQAKAAIKGREHTGFIDAAINATKDIA